MVRFFLCQKPTAPNEKTAGQQYYESICWKAINQSIGRAIRHQNDYATILLVDSRYCHNPLASLKEKLPQWIGDSFRQENSATFRNKEIMETITNFFANKSKQ
jgi:chromosome transmission fidelity protein 1